MTVVSAGVDSANEFSEFTINFANDLSVTAQNTVNTTVADVNGTYQVVSEIEVLLNLTFHGNSSFQALNNTWEVTSYSNTTVSLRSTTNGAVTLVLSKI
ncbi:hypothetical protein [Oceanihabitans sediminis]|uniref:hypothetical protein n=1 Tax=Oceanihabitans sediminis TaxID=1812012 RepID=UPI00299ED93F|nr:hypothetical protein [Oceanihabitans sediminis]MDX1278875.1 hypothetical protein [Oceanihabitans sediminis]